MENKEIAFTDLELKIQKPELSETNTLVVSGNFESLSTQIRSLVDKYKDTVLTEDNLNYVKTLKAHFVSLRTGIEKERKDWKKIYIDPASKSIDAMCKDLLKIVEEGESVLTTQLDEYDQKRKDELTLVLTEYRNEAIEKYELTGQFADAIVLKDKYYNKTQKEEDSYSDIMEQAEEQQKKQTEYQSSVDLITSECEGTLLVVSNYIRLLEYRSVAEILLIIRKDKEEASNLLKEIENKQQKKETIEIGVPEEEINLPEVETKEEKRTRTVRITYTKDKAVLIQQFFIANNIEYQFI